MEGREEEEEEQWDSEGRWGETWGTVLKPMMSVFNFRSTRQTTGRWSLSKRGGDGGKGQKKLSPVGARVLVRHPRHYSVTPLGSSAPFPPSFPPVALSLRRTCP